MAFCNSADITMPLNVEAAEVAAIASNTDQISILKIGRDFPSLNHLMSVEINHMLD